jgi:DNA-binding MarR family transcriptional regulator
MDPVLRELPALLLATASTLVDGINAGVAARGFADVRPAHGFAFARLAGGGATTGDLAEHLGVTKQAAAQLVEDLVTKGYVQRRPHPGDARARLLVLTPRGHACTRAADEAAAETLGPWAATIGPERLRALRADLTLIATPGRLRPTW